MTKPATDNLIVASCEPEEVQKRRIHAASRVLLVRSEPRRGELSCGRWVSTVQGLGAVRSDPHLGRKLKHHHHSRKGSPRWRSVEHTDQRRGLFACAGLVRCICLLAGVVAGTPDSTPHSTIFLLPKAATSSRCPPSAFTYRRRVDTWQSSNPSRPSSRDTSAWSICDSAATSTCVFPAASRTVRMVRRTPRRARRPRPSTRTGSASDGRCRFADVLISNLQSRIRLARLP